jgi:hypothetical protein
MGQKSRSHLEARRRFLLRTTVLTTLRHHNHERVMVARFYHRTRINPVPGYYDSL